MKDIRKLVLTALLAAIAMIIPFAVFFKVIIPPFTATLGSHVPMFLSMLLGPKAAIFVGLGSAFGFFLNLGPLVGARALMHSVVGAIGAVLLKRGWSFTVVALITAPIHGLLEVLVVLPFMPFDAFKLFIVTGVGSMLHHFVDAAISYVMVKALSKSRSFEFAKDSTAN